MKHLLTSVREIKNHSSILDDLGGFDCASNARACFVFAEDFSGMENGRGHGCPCERGAQRHGDFPQLAFHHIVSNGFAGGLDALSGEIICGLEGFEELGEDILIQKTLGFFIE